MVDDLKFFPFGDPAAKPIKQNGQPGVNGAANHALNAYTKVAQQFKEAGGKGLDGLTVKLKEYTEAKVQKLIEAYLDSKVQAQEGATEQRPERAEGQAALPMEVPDPPVTGGGAAYAN